MWHAWGERCLQGFGWEARRKRPLGRPRHRWEDNIKMDLRKIGNDGANWIELAPVASFCERSNEPSDSIKKAGYCLTRWVTVRFSKNVLRHGFT
jgi:hypothetical protein